MIKNYVFPSVFMLGILVLLTTCKEEKVTPVQPEPELPFKQIDYITNKDGDILFEFFYENDTVVEYKYYGDYFAYNRAVFKEGKLFRYYFPEGYYLQFQISPTSNSFLRITSDQDSTRKTGYADFNGNRISTAVFDPSTIYRTDYKFFFKSGGNLGSYFVKVFSSGIQYWYYCTYDNAPNPWYGMRIIDDFMALSKNNCTTINDYPFKTYKYNEEGYMTESNDIYQGVYKYYYR